MITMYVKLTEEEANKLSKACKIDKRTKTNFALKAICDLADKVIANNELEKAINEPDLTDKIN